MRKVLLTSAAISALALSGPAFAACPAHTAAAPSSKEVSAEAETSTMPSEGGVIIAQMDTDDEDGEDDEEDDSY